MEKDDLFLMGQGGGGGLEYASGLYRATGDLDLEALQAEFIANSKPGNRGDVVPVLMGDQEMYDYHRTEANFQEWLVEQGHVERMGCKLVTLMARDVRKEDTGKMGLVVESSVLDLQAEETYSHP